MKLAPGGGISFFLRYFVVPFSLVFFSLSIILAKTSAIKISVCRRKMNPSKMKKKKWEGTMPSISIIEHDAARESKNIEINWFGSSPKCGFITSGPLLEETQTRRTSPTTHKRRVCIMYIFLETNFGHATDKTDIRRTSGVRLLRKIQRIRTNIIRTCIYQDILYAYTRNQLLFLI